MHHTDYNLVQRLMSQLAVQVKKQGFEPLRREWGFVRQGADFIHLFVVVDGYVADTHCLTVLAAVQARAVEEIVATFLARPMLQIDEATIGKGIKVHDKSTWWLQSENDLPQVLSGMLDAFDAALTFFREHDTVQSIAQFLLAKPVHPFSAQRILACAYLLNNMTLLNEVQMKTQDAFGAAGSILDEQLQADYDRFNQLYHKLKIRMLSRPPD